jgi:phage terminase large subunit-like protein
MASKRQNVAATTNSTKSAATESRPPRHLHPDRFTVPHFDSYCAKMVFDDGERRPPEDWQLEIARDIFAGAREVWQITPEGNGKSTFIAQLALYGADYSLAPWIPIGAASAKQARIVYDQAAGFVQRTEGLAERFRCFGGYKLIRSLDNGGIGIEVFAADVKTGDGVIPYPYALLDELHRQEDLRLYNLWKGKLRKRGAQILAISTAGEPETPFENTRDAIRRRATKRHREGSHLRAEGPGLVFHEWMVASDEECSDMAKVKAANPLSTITEEGLREDFESPTLDLGDWKRLKCNRPTRSVATAITDKEWEDAQVSEKIPAGAEVDIGLDVAWKWDTTAAVPCHYDGHRQLLGDPRILVPPRDGSSLHPDEIKATFEELTELFKVDTVVMDISRAEDIGHWLEGELGLRVVDRGQSNQFAVEDYEAFMDGLRNGTLEHTGDPELRTHALNAIARRLPGGDHRFDRAVAGRRGNVLQDRRVIDGLVAAAMVVREQLRKVDPPRSVYDERPVMTA